MHLSATNSRGIKTIFGVGLILAYFALGARLEQHVEHEVHATTVGHGINSDFLPQWYAGRQLFLHHDDPYSSSSTAVVAQLNRVVGPDSFPQAFYTYSYPVYALIVFTPLLLLPFGLVIITCTLGFLAALVVLFYLLIRRSYVGLEAGTAALIALGAFVTVPVYNALGLQQPSIFVLDFMLLTILLIIDRHYRLAGLIAAVVTIKPQLCVVLLPFLLFWCLTSEDPEARDVFITFSCALVALLAFSFLLLPSWVGEFIDSIRFYAGTQNGEPGVRLLSNHYLLDVAVGTVIVLFTALSWYRSLQNHQNYALFFEAIGFSALCTLMVVPRPAFNPYDDILLVLATIPIVRHIAGMSGTRRVCAAAVAVGILVWPIIHAGGPHFTHVVLDTLMKPFHATMAFYLTSTWETATQFYTVWVTPLFFIVLAGSLGNPAGWFISGTDCQMSPSKDLASQ